jgi:glycosyltransferase involved in cell wall biosynthesis
MKAGKPTKNLKMKIGVDVGCLAVKDQRLKLGVFRVAYNLLQELGKRDKKNQYFLYSFQQIPFAYKKTFGENMTNIVAKPASGWRYLALPFALKKTRPDIFLGLSQSLPALIFCPSVIIVHDLGFERYPEAYQNVDKIRKVTKRAVSRANRIIVPSEFTKKDLQKFYQVSENKIEVVYEGCESFFKPANRKEIEKIKIKYSLKSPYFLFVGAFKKTKNLPQIIKAYSKLQSRVKEQSSFVIAGSDFWFDEEIKQAIDSLPNQKIVINLGYVEDKDLPALYSGALAFVSPSLFEGFGITHLEAMKCGCPVIGSKSGATPEVVGQAGILVNPEDEIEIYQAMKKISENASLRQQLIKVGISQAESFSWKNFSNKVLDILTEQERRKWQE